MARRLRRRAQAGSDSPQVVVVGAGFAGLATVSRLAHPVLAVMFARNVYSTFQPLLYQVATAGLSPSDVAYPLRGLAHKYGAALEPQVCRAYRPTAPRLGTQVRRARGGAIQLAELSRRNPAPGARPPS